ncbi:MAG: LysR family transcriptional regulator [Kofleriaceae bacterium]
MRHIPFQQLQAFLAVARTNSFAAAARELGVSRSAVSQSVRHLEEQLRVVLVARTTRSVALTDAGRKLVEAAGPAVSQTLAALTEISAQPGEAVGRLRLTVPRLAMDLLVTSVLPKFRERYPRIEVELVFEDRLVDVVAEGYDAGIRLDEFVERDMVAIRLSDSFRFIVVGSPSYLRAHGVPERPEDLAKHECITFRSGTTGALYAWELERGKKTWRVQARGGLVTNDGLACVSLAAQGLGLAYAMEPMVLEEIRAGTLQRVLEPYAAAVPGFFLYFPSRAQRSTPLRVFVETAQEFARGRRRSASH